MLSGCFHLNDCLAPPFPLPYAVAHKQCVGSFVVRTDKEWAIIAFEGNAALVPFPAYHEDILTEFEYQLLKKQVMAWSKQALLIEFHQRPYASIEISRNHQASCGLFIVRKRHALYVHWDPVALYQHLEGPDILDKDQCAAFLSCRWHYGADTLFKAIKQLPERGCLRLTEHDLTIARPPALGAFEPKRLKADANPAHMLRHLLAEEIKAYNVSLPLCAELSSGLDTALVAQVLSQLVSSEHLLTIGYLPMGTDRAVIQQRRSETVRLLGCRDHCPPIESYFMAGYDQSQKYWPYQAPSLFEKSGAAAKISAAGGQIVFSGIGGDELCTLTDEEQRLYKSPTLPSNLEESLETLLPDDAYHRMQQREVEAWPVGLVPESGHDVAQTIGFAYLRQGVWYAHPLNSVALQSFAHFLPVEWRQGRRLSREALRLCGFSEGFLAQNPKESLSASLDHFILGWPDLESFFAKSLIVQEGLVDLGSGLIN